MTADTHPITELVEDFSRLDSPDDLAAMKRIRTAHKFVFDANALDKKVFFGGADYADQLAEFELLQLPFPEIVFQVGPYEADAEQDPRMGIIHFIGLAWMRDGDICGRIYFVGNGAVNTGRATFRYPPSLTRRQWADMAKPQLDDWCTPDLNPPTGDHFTEDEAGVTRDDVTFCGGILLHTLLYAGLGCLNAGGVVTRSRPEPKFINRQRARKGKTPIFGYSWVTVDPTLLRMPGLCGQGGTHASPRLHWRRGHKRVLPNGRETLVKAHLVGDPDSGFIQHDYRVATRPPEGPEIRP